MAKRSLPTAPSSYELLAGRLLRAINSPAAQRTKHAYLPRLPDDNEDDWRQVLDGLAEEDNVTIAHRDDGSVDVFWTVLKDD
ncbi:DUF1654 domain-containing protein [Pseudomonas sp. PDM14]|uniref:DUF1654 domain-containing protein n=1 Tax=Pseudomonas sp. PDM14 TaxID=2769288 RepID=UPI00177E2B4B|nr:DUF1654 domain-containing protein [Pseudomonas sp. PDM14]MBD9483888.1 DUF1654 domain-containing protein [Pseudomonas sp. PDM14]